MPGTVYLDHAATTPLRPGVFDAMEPYLRDAFGNPSGTHAISRRARQAVDEARETVAGCVGCEPDEVVFTSGGTEADNLAITGAAVGGRGVACTAVEHHAVLHAVEAAGGHILPVDRTGRPVDASLTRWLERGSATAVVSVMLANNEVGVIQPLAEVAEATRRVAPDALVHTDAVQAFAWMDLAVAAAPADLVSLAAHKFGGPKGIGALIVRRPARLSPLLRGGGQERGLRSGTHNVAGIVGMAAAMRATVADRADCAARVRTLRDRLADGILQGVPGAMETVDRGTTLPNICHVLVPRIESESLLVLLDAAGVCASAGSACASGALEPSHVLTAMGIGRAEALGSLRLSLGWSTTADDVDRAVDAVAMAVGRLRAPLSSRSGG